MLGFLLSPLSWWNDLFINLPLATGMAWLAAWFHPPAFETALIVAYWMTNVLGLLLLHLGVRHASIQDQPKLGWRRELLVNLVVSLVYTLLIVLLVRLGMLKPIGSYFAGN